MRLSSFCGVLVAAVSFFLAPAAELCMDVGARIAWAFREAFPTPEPAAALLAFTPAAPPALGRPQARSFRQRLAERPRAMWFGPWLIAGPGGAPA